MGFLFCQIAGSESPLYQAGATTSVDEVTTTSTTTVVTGDDDGASTPSPEAASADDETVPPAGDAITTPPPSTLPIHAHKLTAAAMFIALGFVLWGVWGVSSN